MERHTNRKQTWSFRLPLLVVALEVDPVDEAGAQDGDERVEALGGQVVVGRVVVRLNGKQHLCQVQLKNNRQFFNLLQLSF